MKTAKIILKYSLFVLLGVILSLLVIYLIITVPSYKLNELVHSDYPEYSDAVYSTNAKIGIRGVLIEEQCERLKSYFGGFDLNKTLKKYSGDYSDCYVFGYNTKERSVNPVFYLNVENGYIVTLDKSIYSISDYSRTEFERCFGTPAKSSTPYKT